MFGPVMGLNGALGRPQTPLPQLSPPQRGAPKISGAGSGRGHGAVRDTLSCCVTLGEAQHPVENCGGPSLTAELLG